MIIKTVDAPIFISKLLEHENKKYKILNAIDSMGTYSFKDSGCSLQNTDWHLKQHYKRFYLEIIKEDLEKYVEQAAKSYNSEITNINISNFWMQQYGSDDYHDWHFHPDSMFSAIYYLELPDSTKTNFKFLDKEFTIDCTEGDVITFPSCLAHCSKPNKSGKRKTVIAFNWSLS